MLSKIESRLSSFKPVVNELQVRRASVLIPLLEREGEARLMLTRRSERLRSHSGQVSFPGGKQDEQDQSSLDTALREAREEIGLESKSVRILGCLDQIISLHFYLVTPYVCLIHSDFEAKVYEDWIKNILRSFEGTKLFYNLEYRSMQAAIAYN